MRQIIPIMMALVLLFSSSCGAKKNQGSTQEKTLIGTLDEVKSFMFVVTDDQGDSYAFPIEDERPEGLDERSVGDLVAVTYAGELSVVDAFTGEVYSVEAAE